MDQPLSDYIALNRRFRPHDETCRADDAAAESYLSFWGRSELKGWPQLLAMPGVHVVLGEAGSGRTYEFRARVQSLRSEGQEAYFLSLHKLASMELSQIMDADERQRLSSCLEKNHDAWFFLDAVDESKLQSVSQFREALDKFAALIRPGRGQAKVFISSRVKDWLPVTDRKHVIEALGIHGAAPVNDEEADGDKADGQAKKEAVVHVWTIAPLDKEQVKRYVEGRQVNDSDQFIQAVDAAYAWELAARPLDVNLLASYWITHHTIGRPAEMYEHLITEQLKERPTKTEYERKYPLEPGRAREGAEALAAATILCRRLDFRIEDETHANGGGLDAHACLPVDWSSLALHALLSRPLFDAAIYGSTRFHHRGFAEYLAARWLMRLLQHECSIEEILGLLFDSSRGQWRARQSRLPVAVWLACLGVAPWVHEIRQRLLETAPEAFFRYGDPSLLSIQFKESILDAVTQRYQGRENVRFEISEVALSRMGEPALAAALIRHLESPTVSAALKTEYTKLVRAGRIHAAVPVLLNLLRQADPDSYFTAHILWAMEELGNAQQKRDVAEWSLGLPVIDESTFGNVFDLLFPELLSPVEMRTLLTKIPASSEVSTSLTYKLERGSKALPGIEQVRQFLDMMVSLMELSPCHDRSAVSIQYAWLGSSARCLLRTLLKATCLNAAESTSSARALWICTQSEVSGCFEYDGATSDKEDVELHVLSERHPVVRQQAFWLHYLQERLQDNQRLPSHTSSWVWDYHLHFGRPQDGDFEWVCQELQTTPERRAAVLWLAIDFWIAGGRKRSVKKRILACIRGDAELENELAKSSRPLWLGRLKAWWTRQSYHNGFRNRYWWRNRWKKVKEFYYSKFKNPLWLWWHLKGIRQGKLRGTLDRLLRHCNSDSSHWVRKDWRSLTRKYGCKVTEATQQGCIAVWKDFNPANDAEVTDWLVIGLTGLQHLWQTGQVRFGEWTVSVAEKATRYAIRELNGFSDWLPELAEHHPQAVIRVIEQRMDHEWPLAEGNRGIRIVDRLLWHKSNLGRLLVPSVMRKLQVGDPPGSEGLQSVISLLAVHSDTSHVAFADLAAARTGLYSVNASQHHLWLMLWFQTDTPAALDYFERLVSEGSFTEERATQEAVLICAGLDDRLDRKSLIPSPDYTEADVAERFIRWVHHWVRVESDIHHGSGSYTPTTRDDAQMFRGRLVSALAENANVEAEAVLLSLMNAPELQNQRDYLLHLHERQSKRIADGQPWRENAVRAFQTQHLAEPQSAADLFAVGCRRLHEIKKRVERPFEHASRDFVRADSDEAVVRRYLAMRLSELSHGYYKAPQEAVIRAELRPDIRLESPTISGAVPIEVKIADERTINELVADLQGQLVSDYLSNHSSRHGIFVVGLVGRRPNGWQHPTTREILDFEQMIAYLRERAVALLGEAGRALGLEVVGIDFRLPASSRN